MLTLGLAGAALIKRFEQCRLTSYQDQRGIWTIGWGHTGPEVIEGLTCTQTQADTWFLADTHFAVVAVIKSLAVQLTQNEFDALVCFTFNVGAGSEAHSTLLRLVNLGQTQQAADQFPIWNHVDGVVDPGLTRRRTAEQALFLSPS